MEIFRLLCLGELAEQQQKAPALLRVKSRHPEPNLRMSAFRGKAQIGSNMGGHISQVCEPESKPKLIQ